MAVSSPPFFVVGCPRSGTTLLSVCIDRHSRLCIPPETAFFAEIAPSLPCKDDETLLSILGDWPRLTELNLTPRSVLDRLNGRPSSPRAVLSALLNLYAEANGKVHCGEKTPHHVMHLPALLHAFPDARIVCIVRDGRDVALSLRAMPWGQPTLTAAAELWVTCLRLAEEFKRQVPDQCLIVYYEHLVRKPDQVLSEVMAFLGERYEPQQIQPHVASGVVAARSLPWKGQALLAVDPNQIGRRRAEATPEEIMLLDSALSAELRRHGYLKWIGG